MTINYTSIARVRRLNALETLERRQQSFPGGPASAAMSRAEQARMQSNFQWSSCRSLAH